jgi:hypothetical protein
LATMCVMRTVSGSRLCDVSNCPVTSPCLLHFPLHFFLIDICRFHFYRSVKGQGSHPYKITGTVVCTIHLQFH